MNLLYTILIVTVLMVLCFAGVGIKILVRKNGQFKRHCSSVDPYSGEHGGCLCGHETHGKCAARTRKPYQPLEVNDELMNEINNAKATRGVKKV